MGAESRRRCSAEIGFEGMETFISLIDVTTMIGIKCFLFRYRFEHVIISKLMISIHLLDLVQLDAPLTLKSLP